MAATILEKTAVDIEDHALLIQIKYGLMVVLANEKIKNVKLKLITRAGAIFSAHLIDGTRTTSIFPFFLHVLFFLNNTRSTINHEYYSMGNRQ